MSNGRRFAEGRTPSRRILLTHQPITLTRRAIESIQKRESSLEKLLESTPLVPWEADAKTWRFTYVGPQVEALLGYPRAQWYEPDFWMTHLYAQDGERIVKACRELAATRSHYELKYRMVSKSGRPVWVRDFVTVEARQGRPRVFRGFFCDVTADAQAQERETLMRMLSESIDEIFWFVGLNPSRFIYISPAVEQIMGWKPEKFYGNHEFWLQCIHEEDRARVRKAYVGWLDGTFAEYKLEFRIVLPDGRIRWLADHGALVCDGDGRMSYATGIAKDISVEKQDKENLRRLSGLLISAQEEERKRIARELHDHVSQGLSLLTVELEQLHRHRDTTSSQQDVLAAMQHQLKVLSSDVHALSHELHPSKLKHLGLVSAIRAMCRDVGRAGLTVHFTDDRIPRAVPDDVSLALYRVMQEGLQNVRKHSGTTEVEADLSKVSKVLILRLRDQGKGFHPDTVEPGDGLGLSSMRERLSSVGGTLLIQSAPGEGALLEARVPLSDDGRLS
jgi:PAS domain S-box-containing protein